MMGCKGSMGQQKKSFAPKESSSKTQRKLRKIGLKEKYFSNREMINSILFNLRVIWTLNIWETGLLLVLLFSVDNGAINEIFGTSKYNTKNSVQEMHKTQGISSKVN